MTSSRKAIVAVSILAVSASLIGALQWQKSRAAQGDEANTAAQTASATADSSKTGQRPAAAKLDRAALDEAVKRWHAELLEKYPEFAVHFRTVPDERNGYLHLVRLVEKLGKDGVPDFAAFRAALAQDEKIDPVALAKWFQDHKDLLDELLRVAELPDRSCKEIPQRRFMETSAGNISDLGSVLLLHARQAMASGDHEAALRSQAAAIKLANHVDCVEVSGLLQEVIAVGIRDRVTRDAIAETLPQLAGDPAAIARARLTIAEAFGTQFGFMQLIRGEWNVNMEFFLLPSLLGAEVEGLRIEHPEAVLDHYTRQMQALREAQVSGTLGMTGNNISEEVELPPVPDHLGKDEKALLEFAVKEGMFGIFRGLALDLSQQAMRDAALAIAAGQEVPNDPVTGKPFIWDVASRTLSPPEGSKGLDAIVLPVGVP